MSVGMTKEINKMIKQLEKLGCTVSVTGSGHWRVHRDGCGSVTISKSPSSNRTIRNTRADVNRILGIRL